MGGCLYVVGLGPSGLDKLTLGTYRLIKSAEKTFIRTERHPCAQDLIKEGVKFESFDNIYDQGESFEQVYEKIVERLREELKVHKEVVYAVPGHPTVAEQTVQIIWESLAKEYQVKIYPAVSFIDEVMCSIPFDPIHGLVLRNHDSLGSGILRGKDWVIVTQVYDKFIASELKLDLMQYYPDDLQVYIVQALGTENQRVLEIPLYELDHHDFDHLTSIVIPPREDFGIARLLEVMQSLRSPEGCPWDKEQTHQSLKPYLIEESYEVIDAIDKGDMYNLCEELGDLLLQVVFHSQVAAEAGEFNFHDVVKGITEKLIRRHPHVFADVQADTSAEVLKNWEKIKREEKGDAKEKKEFFDLPDALPALMLAQRVQKKAAKFGFDWSDLNGPMDKIQEELKELQEAISCGRGISEEMGDLLFAIVNLSRFLELEAEETLRVTILKFKRRFHRMYELAKLDRQNFEDLSLAEMDRYWDQVKKEEKCAKII
ncbi:MAG: nucleoside triphosphate pyrophosphohydrolase [Desulfitobacterium hafniense]|nr:nucleoside triphosphate pyrophosphohydrolase [Desulfitobacterium hafniense]